MESRMRQVGVVARTPLAIRRAIEEDVTEVVLLERETATAPHWAVADYVEALQPLAPGGGVGHGAGRDIGGLKRALFVAAEGREVCGFAVGKVLRAGREVEGELESVVVHAGLRRQGVGSSLCRMVMQWAREQGAGKMLLEVRAGSAGAVQLYRGLGFVAMGRRPRYYHNPVEDALLMRCGLRPQAMGVAEGERERDLSAG